MYIELAFVLHIWLGGLTLQFVGPWDVQTGVPHTSAQHVAKYICLSNVNNTLFIHRWKELRKVIQPVLPKYMVN